MSGSDSENDTEIQEEEDFLVESLSESKQIDHIASLVDNNVDESGRLPWRLFYNTSDSFVLWTCASRKIFVGPHYTEENKTVSVEVKAEYAQLPLNSVQQSKNRVHTFLSEAEQYELQQDIKTPFIGGMVNFVMEVLAVCNMPQDEAHVYDFLSRLDFSGMM